MRLIEQSAINDDDLYVYDAKTLELVRVWPASSPEARNSRFRGFSAATGLTLKKGMAIKNLKLWSKK